MNQHKFKQPFAEVAVKQVLPFIYHYEKKLGITPTFEEIGEKFNRTKEWGRLVVKFLVKQKLLKYKKGMWRGIRLVK